MGIRGKLGTGFLAFVLVALVTSAGYADEAPGGKPGGGEAAVVLRTADCLTGLWDGQREIVTAEEVPSLYAPYMPPRWNDGEDIYFALSRFDEYDVYWWRTSLAEEPERGIPGHGGPGHKGKGPKHGGHGDPAKCAAP